MQSQDIKVICAAKNGYTGRDTGDRPQERTREMAQGRTEDAGNAVSQPDQGLLLISAWTKL